MKRAFKGISSFPVWKVKSGEQSATFVKKSFRWCPSAPSSVSKLKVSGIGYLDVRWSRNIANYDPTTVTITKSPSGKYYVTLSVIRLMAPKSSTFKKVGVDVGIRHLYITSDNCFVDNLSYYRRYETQLAKAQRALSRKVKGSARYEKQRVKVARLHEKICNCRKDFIDKFTTSLVENYDVIAIEDLNVKGMLKNHKLAKSIQDASFGMFRRMLSYKCSWYGKNLVIVDRWFPSSKRCSSCGHIHPSMKLSVREFHCESCKAFHNRDENASKNLLWYLEMVEMAAHFNIPTQQIKKFISLNNFLIFSSGEGPLEVPASGTEDSPRYKIDSRGKIACGEDVKPESVTMQIDTECLGLKSKAGYPSLRRVPIFSEDIVP